MQINPKRGEAAFRIRGVGLSVAVLASATLSLSAPDRALAACGGSSHPAGVHTGAATGVHAATTTVATSGGAGGGAGSLGCAGGSSASALRGLPVASSGRVLETGAHAGHNETHARTANTRIANAGVHMHAFGHGHRP
jgi:hypothetical protein